MGKKEDAEIRDVMRGERRRGKNKAAQAAEDERMLMAKLRTALEAATEREFVDRLRRLLGITEASPQFSRILQIWRDEH